MFSITEHSYSICTFEAPKFSVIFIGENCKKPKKIRDRAIFSKRPINYVKICLAPPAYSGKYIIENYAGTRFTFHKAAGIHGIKLCQVGEEVIERNRKTK